MGEPSSRRRSGELGLLLAAGMGRGLEPGAAGGGSRGSRKCSQGLCSSSGPGPGASRGPGPARNPGPGHSGGWPGSRRPGPGVSGRPGPGMKGDTGPGPGNLGSSSGVPGGWAARLARDWTPRTDCCCSPPRPAPPSKPGGSLGPGPGAGLSGALLGSVSVSVLPSVSVWKLASRSSAVMAPRMSTCCKYFCQNMLQHTTVTTHNFKYKSYRVSDSQRCKRGQIEARRTVSGFLVSSLLLQPLLLQMLSLEQ